MRKKSQQQINCQFLRLHSCIWGRKLSKVVCLTYSWQSSSSNWRYLLEADRGQARGLTLLVQFPPPISLTAKSGLAPNVSNKDQDSAVFTAESDLVGLLQQCLVGDPTALSGSSCKRGERRRGGGGGGAGCIGGGDQAKYKRAWSWRSEMNQNCASDSAL